MILDTRYFILNYMINKLRVAVLRGGPSDEHMISMRTGSNLLDNLSQEKYIVYDISISKDGNWYFNGGQVIPEKFLRHIDVVLNALHGNYGGDGKIQKLLDHFNIPYTGSDSFGSALSMNKNLSKQVYKKIGIKTPYHSLLKKENYTDNSVFEIFREIPMPCVVKPINSGSSVGVYVAGSLDELVNAIDGAFEFADSILVEEFINGKEIICGVIDNFRESEHYSLLPTELVLSEGNGILRNDDKYIGFFEEITPGRLSQNEKNEIQRLAVEAHKALGLRHYSSSDFIVHPKRGIYLLETNSLPALHEEAIIPKSLEIIGSNLSEFLDHLIELTNHGK